MPRWDRLLRNQSIIRSVGLSDGFSRLKGVLLTIRASFGNIFSFWLGMMFVLFSLIYLGLLCKRELNVNREVDFFEYCMTQHVGIFIQSFGD